MPPDFDCSRSSDAQKLVSGLPSSTSASTHESRSEAPVEGLRRATNDNVRRILIVDDERAVLDAFVQIFLRFNERAKSTRPGTKLCSSDSSPPLFHVVCSQSGENAVRMVAEANRDNCPFHAAVVDIAMPGWDGFDTVEGIWRDDPDLPVILCSGNLNNLWPTIVSRLGVTDRHVVLHKPFSPSEALFLVQTLTTKRMDTIRSRSTRRQYESLAATHQRVVADNDTRMQEEAERRQQLEDELNTSRRLVAIGHLAAGIAHEINTPIQFVADNVEFLKDCFSDLQTLRSDYRDATAKMDTTAARESLSNIFDEADENADWDYLAENTPTAFRRVQEGIERVSSIVRAMKDFAYMKKEERAPADINKAIRSTLTVAKNEYKYVADIDTSLGDLPLVSCHVGDLNQVFLNLVVNAAHAIETAIKGTEKRGTISIKTEQTDDCVTITIADTGCGIPEELKKRIFEPFFTTKDHGKGTGQGLAISRAIIEDKHQGRLEVKSEPGQGTSFIIHLPHGDDAVQ